MGRLGKRRAAAARRARSDCGAGDGALPRGRWLLQRRPLTERRQPGIPPAARRASAATERATQCGRPATLPRAFHCHGPTAAPVPASGLQSLASLPQCLCDSRPPDAADFFGMHTPRSPSLSPPPPEEEPPAGLPTGLALGRPRISPSPPPAEVLERFGGSPQGRRVA